MTNRTVSGCLVLSALVVALGAPEASAQERRLAVEAEAGVAFPVGQTEDYFQVGPTMGVRATWGLNGWLDLVGNLGLDKLGGDKYIGTPDFRAMRFEVGGETSLFEDTEGNETVRIRALASVGATKFISDTFLRRTDPPTDAHRDSIAAWVPVVGNAKFEKTYLSGTGGLRFLIGDDAGLSGSFSIIAHWSPMKSGDTAVLKESDILRQLDPSGFLRSTITIPVTASIRLPL